MEHKQERSGERKREHIPVKGVHVALKISARCSITVPVGKVFFYSAASWSQSNQAGK